MRLWMKLLAAATAAASIPSVGQAAISISSVAATDPYSGPPVTWNFDPAGTAFRTGGAIVSGAVANTHIPPLGSGASNYWSVGPSDGTPGVLDLSSFGAIGEISFLWGSIDTYNVLEVLGPASVLLTSFTGSSLGITPDSLTTRLVTLSFTDADIDAVTSLRLSSGINAFETDNYSIRPPVPEPATWAMMLLGFGAVGLSFRRRRRERALLQIA